MTSFSDYSVWSFILIMIVLLCSLLVANVLKRRVPFLKKSLIPNSVLGGIIILLTEWIYKLISGNDFFEAAMFGVNGNETLETITYHCLALGFIASSFNTTNAKLTKKRVNEIINTGVTTVATYLLQGIFGLVITIIAAEVISGFFVGAGILLPVMGRERVRRLTGAVYTNLKMDSLTERALALRLRRLDFCPQLSAE